MRIQSNYISNNQELVVEIILFHTMDLLKLITLVQTLFSTIQDNSVILCDCIFVEISLKNQFSSLEKIRFVCEKIEWFFFSVIKPYLFERAKLS